MLIHAKITLILFILLINCAYTESARKIVKCNQLVTGVR